MIWSYHCLNIVIVKESKIGQCVFLHFDMNRTGFTSTLIFKDYFPVKSISEPLHIMYFKRIMVNLGCLISPDEGSLHQYCINNSPDIFCLRSLTNSRYFPCFVLFLYLKKI